VAYKQTNATFRGKFCVVQHDFKKYNREIYFLTQTTAIYEQKIVKAASLLF
jgi:hypothetical protein